MRGWIMAGLVVLAVSSVGIGSNADVHAPGIEAGIDADGSDAPDAFSRTHRAHLRAIETAKSQAAPAPVAAPAAPTP